MQSFISILATPCSAELGLIHGAGDTLQTHGDLTGAFRPGRLHLRGLGSTCLVKNDILFTVVPQLERKRSHIFISINGKMHLTKSPKQLHSHPLNIPEEQCYYPEKPHL